MHKFSMANLNSNKLGGNRYNIAHQTHIWLSILEPKSSYLRFVVGVCYKKVVESYWS